MRGGFRLRQLVGILRILDPTEAFRDIAFHLLQVLLRIRIGLAVRFLYLVRDRFLLLRKLIRQFVVGRLAVDRLLQAIHLPFRIALRGRYVLGAAFRQIVCGLPGGLRCLFASRFQPRRVEAVEFLREFRLFLGRICELLGGLFANGFVGVLFVEGFQLVFDIAFQCGAVAFELLQFLAGRCQSFRTARQLLREVLKCLGRLGHFLIGFGGVVGHRLFGFLQLV